MRTSGRKRRAARTATRGRSFSPTRQLEHELSYAHRDLATLQNEYLELGLQVSILASERDAARLAYEHTEAYLDSLGPRGEAATGSGRRAAAAAEGSPSADQPAAASRRRDGKPAAGSPDEAGVTGDRRPAPGWRPLDRFRMWLASRSRRLEAELSAVQREVARLDDDYRQLAERADNIGRERDAALEALDAARQCAETAVPGSGPVVHQPDPEPGPPAAQEAEPERARTLRHQLSAIEAELDTSRRQVKSLQTALVEAASLRDTAVRQVQALGRELQESQAIRAELERQTSTLEALVARLRAERDELSGPLDGSEAGSEPGRAEREGIERPAAEGSGSPEPGPDSAVANLGHGHGKG